jgi:hypothetical protein
MKKLTGIIIIACVMTSCNNNGDNSGSYDDSTINTSGTNTNLTPNGNGSSTGIVDSSATTNSNNHEAIDTGSSKRMNHTSDSSRIINR